MERIQSLTYLLLTIAGISAAAFFCGTIYTSLAWLAWIAVSLFVLAVLSVILKKLLVPAYLAYSTHVAERDVLRAVAFSLQDASDRGEPLEYINAVGHTLKIGQRASSLRASRETVVVEDAPLALPAPSILPTSVRYEDIRSQVPDGHAVLGVDEAGQVATCDFKSLMTMWICGGSSTGKSNTVALKIDEAIRNGRNIKLVVIDPHARKEDSLYNKIRCYEDRFLFKVAVSPDEQKAALEWYHAEFQRRLLTGSGDNDLLLIIDECSNVAASEDKRTVWLLKEIARICGQESRGFGMFGWFLSQKAAGLAWLRNTVITVIAHKMVMTSERLLACNEDRSIARSMDRWPRGRVVVYGVEFEPQVYQMPLFNPPLARVIESHSSASGRSSAQLMEVHQEVAQEARGRMHSDDQSPTDLSTVKILREIGKRIQNGEDPGQIVKSFGLPYGRATQELRAVVDMVAAQSEGGAL